MKFFKCIYCITLISVATLFYGQKNTLVSNLGNGDYLYTSIRRERDTCQIYIVKLHYYKDHGTEEINTLNMNYNTCQRVEELIVKNKVKTRNNYRHIVIQQPPVHIISEYNKKEFIDKFGNYYKNRASFRFDYSSESIGFTVRSDGNSTIGIASLECDDDQKCNYYKLRKSIINIVIKMWSESIMDSSGFL